MVAERFASAQGRGIASETILNQRFEALPPLPAWPAE
jgi:hypothetical protein